MTRTLKRIDPIKFGIIFGLIYGLISLLSVPFFLLFIGISAFLPQQHNGLPLFAMTGIGLLFCILIPVFYAAMGCVMGMLMAWLYNVVAKWVGGVQFEVE